MSNDSTCDSTSEEPPSQYPNLSMYFIFTALVFLLALQVAICAGEPFVYTTGLKILLGFSVLCIIYFYRTRLKKIVPALEDPKIIGLSIPSDKIYAEKWYNIYTNLSIFMSDFLSFIVPIAPIESCNPYHKYSLVLASIPFKSVESHFYSDKKFEFDGKICVIGIQFAPAEYFPKLHNGLLVM